MNKTNRVTSFGFFFVNCIISKANNVDTEVDYFPIILVASGKKQKTSPGLHGTVSSPVYSPE